MNSTILHPDVWRYDLENRGYTVEETANGSLTLIVVKESGVEVGRIEASGREGIWILRERLEGGESLLPCLTTAQRGSLAFKIGHQIINLTRSSVVECWDGTVWQGVLSAACRVFTTAGQVIVDATWDTVAWASESYDTHSMHDNVTDNSRITIPTIGAGRYLVTASLSFVASGTGSRGIRLRKNGAGQVRRVLNANAGVDDFVSTELSDVLNLAADDYLEIAAWQDSGGTLALLAGADRNHFTVTKIP